VLSSTAGSQGFAFGGEGSSSEGEEKLDGEETALKQPLPGVHTAAGF